jgi:hypothetical protein
MTELCELAIKHGTDKWPFHKYTPHYHELFKDWRNDVRKVLEIGIGDDSMKNTIPNYVSGASLRMWHEYFPNADIYGLDNNSNTLITGERIWSFLCDQGDPMQLDGVQVTIGKDFDLIVDDGCHIPEVQILTAKMLVPLLSPDGFYVIEDVWIYPSTVGWTTEPFGLKVEDLPYQYRVIAADGEGNNGGHLVVLEQ